MNQDSITISFDAINLHPDTIGNESSQSKKLSQISTGIASLGIEESSEDFALLKKGNSNTLTDKS